MCNEPKLMKAENICATKFMSICKDEKTRLSDQFHSSNLVESETERDRELIVSLTPITNTNSVLSPSIKHRTDDHKARRDGAFAHSEDETDGKETSEVLASGMAT
jgi:hypothetical protein